MSIYQFTSDNNKNVQTLEHALIELYKTIDNIEIIFENDLLYDGFKYIRRITQNNSYRVLDNNCEIFIRNKFYDYLSKVLQKITPTCGDLNPHSSDKIEARKINIINDSLYIINFIVSSSSTFRIEFFKSGGTKELFNFLKNNDFVNNFNGEHFFSTILGNINWLSRHADSFKNEWRSLDVVGLLLNIARTYPSCKMPAYSAFANIANDNEISTLPEMDVIVPLYINCVNTTVKEFSKENNQIERIRITFNEEENDDKPEFYDVYFVRLDYCTTHSLTGILLTLYRLSINNKIKYDLYVKHNLKENLPVIIYKGSEIEKKYALKLLAQLCFDPQVNDLIFNNNTLKDYIKNLSTDKSITNKSIVKICDQILWSMETNHKVLNKNQTPSTTTHVLQVMISYNSASRSLCVKIKEELEKANFRVWIDINEIHGSSLESMARAIESSDFILICVTEKYRQSINCQAEAQYAFKLQKNIIPLIMQEGYERVDGWLGMIMGDKIYINFTKFNFDESITRLLHDINLKSNKNSKSLEDNETFTKVSVQPLQLHLNNGTTPSSLFFNRFPLPFYTHDEEFVATYNDRIVNFQTSVMKDIICFSEKKAKLYKERIDNHMANSENVPNEKGDYLEKKIKAKELQKTSYFESKMNKVRRCISLPFVIKSKSLNDNSHLSNNTDATSDINRSFRQNNRNSTPNLSRRSSLNSNSRNSSDSRTFNNEYLNNNNNNNNNYNNNKINNYNREYVQYDNYNNSRTYSNQRFFRKNNSNRYNNNNNINNSSNSYNNVRNRYNGGRYINSEKSVRFKDNDFRNVQD